MKHINYFLLVAAALAITGCTKDSYEENYSSSVISSSSSTDTSESTGSTDFSDSGLATASSSTSSDSEALNWVPDTVDYTNDYIEKNFTASATTTITFSSSGASCDNVLDGDEITINGNYVVATLTNSGTVLKLTGDASTGGAIKITSDKKFELNLANVSITNPNGSAINIQNGHCFVVVDGSNTLADGSSAGYSDTYSDGGKSVFHNEDKLRFSGSGTLTIKASNAASKHALTSDDWIFVNGPTITATAGSGAGQCIKTNDGFHLVSGTVNATASADGKKAIKSDAFVYVEGGTLYATASGSTTYDSDDSEYKAASAVNADGYVMITGGTVNANCSGSGGKGINSDYIIHIKGGSTTVAATGSSYGSSSGGRNSSSSDSSKSPKGMKADGSIVIEGGTVDVTSKSSEGIESKGIIRISGGYVSATASDDAINSSYETTISGGYVMANSSGNDGIDSNKNMYIKGGYIFAVATSQPEVGLDANTESGYQVYITGGNLVAIGGIENGANISNGTAYQASYSKGTWYGLTKNDAVVMSFKVPSNNSMGASMAVYTTGTTALYSGVTASGTTFWNGYGSTSCSGGSGVSLSTYSGGSGMSGGGMPGGTPPGGF